MRFKFLYVLLVFSLLATKCKDKNNVQSVDNFDRETLLTEVTINYIIPAYENYQAKTAILESDIKTFGNNLIETNLESCRASYILARTAWQEVAMLEFGPAANIGLRSQSNLYPVDTSIVQNNISANTWDLASVSNYKAKGFEAIDYLLYKSNLSNSELINYFANNTSAFNYLIEVAEDINSNASIVNNDWSDYQTEFIADNTDNAIGSSISDLLNSLSLHFETFIRKGKVGIPLGIFSGITQTTLPNNVEGNYSNQSLAFLKQSILNTKYLFFGYSNNGSNNFQGFDDYLDHINYQYGNDKLSLAIENNLNEIESKIDALENSLKNNLDNNYDDVKALYNLLQQTVPLIKVEATSALGVLVSYQDNDGD